MGSPIALFAATIALAYIGIADAFYFRAAMVMIGIVGLTYAAGLGYALTTAPRNFGFPLHH